MGNEFFQIMEIGKLYKMFLKILPGEKKNKYTNNSNITISNVFQIS